MNLSHLTTLVWLRWRLALADLRRMGVASRVIIGLLLAVLVITSLAGFVLTLVLGVVLLPKAQPDHLLIIGDILAVGFLFFWMIGFMSELQRSEPFSLEKLLHLPISIRGAFLLNYFSSFASLTMVVFLPAMLAFCIALPFALGWPMVFAFPLMVGFLLLITAVTFQIRGWLATLMSTPRRRRRVMVILTTLFVLVFQVPNFTSMWINRSGKDDESARQMQEAQAALDEQIAVEDISPEEKQDLMQQKNLAREQYTETRKEHSDQVRAQIVSWVKRGHVAIPLGWFPYGIYRIAEGVVWPAILGTCGLVLLAAFSLHISYRSTIRFYRQAETATAGKKTKKAVASGHAAEATAPEPFREPVRKNALRKPFPFIPLKPGMIARANFSNLLRAPEVKMQLIAPVLVTVLLAFPLYSNRKELPPAIGPLAVLGFMVFANLTSVSLMFNQFGYDRHGFRSYMLWPVSGRDLIFGKNVSLAPFSFGISLLAVTVARMIFPIPIMDLLACLPAAVSLFLIWLMLGNVMSIRFPLPVSASAMRKAQPNWKTVLAQFIAVMLMPLLLTPVMVPMAIQSACHHFGWLPWVPVALLLELAVVACVIWLYGQLLPVYGRFLKSREQQILQEVTRRDK